MGHLLHWAGIFAVAFVAALVSCADEGKKFEDACLDYCDAQEAAGCAQQFITVEQCRASCGLYESQLGGLCLTEYTATFECSAAAGFECIMGYPAPKGGACLSETNALLTCQEQASCISYCSSAVDAGCGGSDTASCETQCQAEREDLADPYYCDFEYDDLLTCWGETGVTCSNGQAVAGGCGEEVLSVGDCIGFDNLCAGYCWAAERFECGAETCASDCSVKAGDPTCGRDYEDLLECVLREYEATCVDGLLFSEFCDYERMQYEQCLSG